MKRKKKIKKIVSFLLAMVMALAVTTTVNAATVTVPVDGILKNHTFTAYQVFSGREEGSILSDVQWGNGIDEDYFLDALITDTTYGSLFTDCTDTAAVGSVLAANNTNTALANAIAELAYANRTSDGTTLTAGENTLAGGYYLIVDTTENVAAGSAYNKALLQVAGDINITVKTDAPTVEKKVLEDDKYNQDDGFGQGYNDAADYNMGDAVPFRLIGSVPDMSRYETYKYIFHDTLSPGLTLNEGSIKVYAASDKAGTDKAEIIGWTKNVYGQSFTVSFDDLKTVSDVGQGKYVIVEYTAVLNQNAQVGLDGNPNSAYLEYSNKPDQSTSVGNNTGNTPEDKVIVFTYELDTVKVNGQNDTEKLQGAEFKLHNTDNKWVIVNADGKVTGWADTEAEGSVLTYDANGLFKVIGLDDGQYYLKEIKAPAGYNTLSSEIMVLIYAVTINGQTWTDGVASSILKSLEVTADGRYRIGDVSTGIAEITVANNKGITLPETGGTGTTLIYIIGAVLVIGAAVLLVARRRASVGK